MANCVYCVHSLQSPLGGLIRCGCEKARDELGEEEIKRLLRNPDHQCPHFKDDQLPW